MSHLPKQAYKTAIAEIQSKSPYFEKGRMSRTLEPLLDVRLVTLLNNFDPEFWKRSIRETYSDENRESRRKLEGVFSVLDRSYPEHMRRKLPGNSEKSHPYRVAGFVAGTNAELEWTYAAALHDVVEDWKEGKIAYFLLSGKKASSVEDIFGDIAKRTTETAAGWVRLLTDGEMCYPLYLTRAYSQLATAIIKGIDGIVRLPEYDSGSPSLTERGIAKLAMQTRRLRKIYWLLYEVALLGIKQYEIKTSYEGAWQYLSTVSKSDYDKLVRGYTVCDAFGYNRRILDQIAPHGSRIINTYGLAHSGGAPLVHIEYPFISSVETGTEMTAKSFRDAGVTIDKLAPIPSLLPKHIAQNKVILEVKLDPSDLKGHVERLGLLVVQNYDLELDRIFAGGYSRQDEANDVWEGAFSPKYFIKRREILAQENAGYLAKSGLLAAGRMKPAGQVRREKHNESFGTASQPLVEERV